MAARVTRSASGGSRSTDAMFAEPQQYRNEERMMTKILDQLKNGRLPAELLPLLRNFHTAVMESPCSRCLLLALSHDELGVIFDGLADPLQPVVAVAFSSTCKGLRTQQLAALEVLEERHAKARQLCRKLGRVWTEEQYVNCSCATLRDAVKLELRYEVDLTNDDMAVLAVLLANWLPKLRMLEVIGNDVGERTEFIQTLCESLGRGAGPSIVELNFTCCKLRPAGTKALALALRTGALPKVEMLALGGNCFGNQGVAALALPLRKLPALKELFLWGCDIGDEGVASLMADLGKDDFKALTRLSLYKNQLSSDGIATIIPALKAGAMPALRHLKIPRLSPAGLEQEIKEALNAVRASLAVHVGDDGETDVETDDDDNSDDL